ncbi:MAG: tetratricopeptide repeat protein [Arthrospira sp. PLM2.Bin9]|nr:tetratricopeptide repeat-containing sulfotransferase family protein [Arthrospira sp. PLM2.Bin9]TVU53449.1 MAG: tetratricopeptide repeat protein [Arthrospira sp. PLM2.Bin9]
MSVPNPEAEALSLHQKAENYLAQGKAEKAIAFYQKAIQLNPDFSWSHHKLGDAFSQLERWEDARSAYQKAIALNSDFFWSYNNLGNTLIKQGHWSAAIQVYQQAISIEPHFPWCYYNLGNAYSYIGEWEKSIDAYLTACQLDENLPDIDEKLGNALAGYCQGYLDNVIENLTILPSFQDITIYQKLADNLARKDYWLGAIILYQKVLAIDPENPDILPKLNQAWERQRELEDQVNIQNQIVKQHPDSYDAYYSLGNALFQVGKWHQAIEAYLRSMELKPNLPPWLYKDLWILLKAEGRLGEVVDLYKKAIVKNPKSYELYINLGEVFAQQGNLEAAINCNCQATNIKFNQELINPGVPPKFMIIGTQKGGTTSLYYYLEKHPQTALSVIKEIEFWSRKFDRGLDWYLSHFCTMPKANRVMTGEATPSYLDCQPVAERLFNFYPDIRLIVLLRNPIYRAISHYYHWVNIGWESRDLSTAIAAEINRFKQGNNQVWDCPHSYLARGIYVEFLKHWLSIFPKANFLILKSEDLYNSPAATLTRVQKFLGLTDYSLKTYPKYNSRFYPDVTELWRYKLAKFYEPYNQELEDFLGVKFGWDSG